jgi:hypothetical protein
MVLRLLLDEHFSEQDAVQLRLHEPTLDVVSLHVWEGGAYMRLGDPVILAEAHQQGRTLVTRDLRTVPPLLKEWAQAGISHGGVILVDHRAIPEGNTGALIRALRRLWSEDVVADWTDQVVYLQPAEA